MRKRFTYRGKYKPANPEKYAGNVNNIVYRSSWERRFMVYCDNNEAITFWSSEELVIPYISPVDRRQHKYYPDFVIKIQDARPMRLGLNTSLIQQMEQQYLELYQMINKDK